MTLAATSHAARSAVEENGGIGAGCERVMLYLHRYPNESFTRAEIAQGAGMKLQTVCARVRDLLDDPKCRIEELAARACTVTGNSSKPLRVAQHHQPGRMPDERGNPEFRTQAGSPNAAAPAETPSPKPDTQAVERAAAAPPLAPGASGLEIARHRAAQAQANRQAMPIVTALVDELRKSFPDAKVTYAHEGERSFGKAAEPGVQASDSSPGMERPKSRRAA